MTKNQLQILKYLENKDVLIEHRSNERYYVTKSGLIFKQITENTFEAIRPMLQLHNFNNKVIYTLK